MDLFSYLLGKKASGGGGSNLQTKSVTITQNGSSQITPDIGYDGLSSVNVTTNVDTGSYKVNSIAEMNNLTGMQTGDYCIVDTTNILPTGYTRVDYIKSTGTQYIILDYYTNPNSQFDLTLKIGNYKSDDTIENYFSGFLNSRNRNTSDYGCSLNFGNASTAKYMLFVWARNGQSVTALVNDSEIIENKNTLSWHGTNFAYGDYIATVESMNTTATMPLSLFGGTRSTSGNTIVPFSIANMYVYDFKISENNVLLHHYIPCYRNSDNEMGLYDIINDTFYSNAGTGTFVTYQKDKYYDVYYYDGTNWKYV